MESMTAFKPQCGLVAGQRLAPQQTVVIHRCLVPTLSKVHCRARLAQVKVQATSGPEPFISSSGPLDHITQPATALIDWAVRVVHDAVCLFQRLIHLVQRIRVAAALIKSQAERDRIVSEVQVAARKMPPVQLPFNPIETLALGAATHLRQTLTDAGGTLDSKWKALETSTNAAMNQLFRATHASAEALNTYDGTDVGSASSRMWSHESTADVLQQEQQLRDQVFAQVIAELTAKDKSSGQGPRAGYGFAF